MSPLPEYLWYRFPVSHSHRPHGNMSMNSQANLTVAHGTRSRLLWVCGLSGTQRGMKRYSGGAQRVDERPGSEGVQKGLSMSRSRKQGREPEGEKGDLWLKCLLCHHRGLWGCHAFINPGASECLSVMSPPCCDPSCRLSGWPVSSGQSPCSSGGQCQMTFSLTLLISLPRNHA